MPIFRPCSFSQTIYDRVIAAVAALETISGGGADIRLFDECESGVDSSDAADIHKTSLFGFIPLSSNGRYVSLNPLTSGCSAHVGYESGNTINLSPGCGLGAIMQRRVAQFAQRHVAAAAVPPVPRGGGGRRSVPCWSATSSLWEVRRD